jgi:hypothetical protein
MKAFEAYRELERTTVGLLKDSRDCIMLLCAADGSDICLLSCEDVSWKPGGLASETLAEKTIMFSEFPEKGISESSS